MKFWQKLYLSALTLFLFVFVCSVFLLVRSIYENNLTMEKSKGNKEAFWLEQRLSDDFADARGEGALSEEEVRSVLTSYAHDYVAQNSLFSLYYNQELIYTNIGFDDAALIPEGTVMSAQSKVYWQEDGRSFYCVYLPISEDSAYTLLYLHELVGLSQFMEELGSICLTTGGIGSVFLAFLLYFLVKRLTKPLGKPDVAANEMTHGKYDTCVAIKGRDEFASVAQSFNDMACEVQKHITTLERENQNKQIFIDNLAHEMSTPLTSIRGYGKYLQRGVPAGQGER